MRIFVQWEVPNLIRRLPTPLLKSSTTPKKVDKLPQIIYYQSATDPRTPPEQLEA